MSAATDLLRRAAELLRNPNVKVDLLPTQLHGNAPNVKLLPAQLDTDASLLAAADPREQALDRMAENAQELGLYDDKEQS